MLFFDIILFDTYFFTFYPKKTFHTNDIGITDPCIMYGYILCHTF